MKNKNAKTPDWVRAFSFKKILPGIEKIGFTTLGILLALWVNNYDEGRKNMKSNKKPSLKSSWIGARPPRFAGNHRWVRLSGLEYRNDF
ncbi:MAG: hypothetical protein IPH31_01240 [Lewinellaceae bacterium]|nr:hypothetical protein [Lewinellaceae bacterium]